MEIRVGISGSKNGKREEKVERASRNQEGKGKKGAAKAPGKENSQTKFHIGGIYRWMDFRSLGDWQTSVGATAVIPRRFASLTEYVKANMSKALLPLNCLRLTAFTCEKIKFTVSCVKSSKEEPLGTISRKRI